MTDAVPERIPEEIVDRRPVVKLVWIWITTYADDPFIAKDCIEWTALSPVAVYAALEDLESMGFVECEPDPMAPRQSRYYPQSVS